MATATYDTFAAATGHTGTPATGTIETFSITIGAGSDRIVLVGVGVGAQAGSGSTPNDAATLSVTCQGTGDGSPVAMTDCGLGQIHAAASDGGFIQLFYRLSPPTGSNTIVVSCVSSLGIFFASTAGAISASNVDQSTIFRNLASATGNSASASRTVTAGNTDELLFDYVGAGSDLTTHNRTTRWVDNQSGASQCGNSGMATAAGSASTVAMTRSLSGGDSWAIITGALIGSSGGGGATVARQYRSRLVSLTFR